ncbi:hypothetical protein J3E71DRAFT_175281 [Bipolaris maydis]|nr:hypothetical protein J3E71DRAFT_175281 [Bipolaris maydis]
MLADSIQKFCTNTTCGVCEYYVECFCLDTLSYSEIVPNRNLWPAGLQDAHYIQLLRHSVMIKLPLVQYNSLPKDERNFRNVHIPAHTVIAILPLSPRSHKNSLLGILLQHMSSASYVRLSTKPLLLQEDMIGAVQAELGAYAVHDIYPNRGVGPVGKNIPNYIDQNWLREYIKFKLHSATLTAEEWHCETQSYPTTTCIGTKAQFPLPIHRQDKFSVTVSFRDVSDPGFSGTIFLGNSVTQMELRAIRLSEGPNVSHPSFLKRGNQTQRCMRVSALIPSTQDFIEVILRKLPATEVVFSDGEVFENPSQNNIAISMIDDLRILRYQYRLDINRLSGEKKVQESSLQPVRLRSRI